MSCPFEDDVYRLFDHELPFARRMVVEAHLAVCGSCARIEETLDRVERVLATGDERPLGVIEPLLARLQRPEPGRRVSHVVGGIAAGLAAALLVAVLWPRTPKPSTPRPPAPVAVEPATPPLPPPTVPDLRAFVRALDPADEAAVSRLADRVRRHGAAGTSVLADLLDPAGGELTARALAVARRAPSPRLAPDLAALLADPAFAPRAARLLGIVGTPREVDALAEALDGPASVEAREALVAIGGTAALDVLVARLDQDPELLDAVVRVSPERGARLVARDGARARRVLARRRDVLLPELRRRARGGDLGAVRALGRAKDAGAYELLVRLLGRSASAPGAARALVTLGTEDALAAAFHAVRRGGAPEEVFDGAGHAEPFLLERLRAHALPERRTALRLLRQCGGGATVRALGERRPSRALLPDAIAAVAAIGGDDAVTVLASWRGERGVRRALVVALGATGDPRAVPALEEFAGDAALAEDVAAALARIPHEESARVLVDLLLRRRAEAGAALASMPAGVVVPVLLDRFDASRAVRRVLVRIAGADHGGRPETWKKWWDGSRP